MFRNTGFQFSLELMMLCALLAVHLDRWWVAEKPSHILETLGSALSLEDHIWTSHFPVLNSLHQQWSEEKQSELIYVTVHTAALHKKEAHKCSTHFSTQLLNETLLVNSLTNTNK